MGFLEDRERFARAASRLLPRGLAWAFSPSSTAWALLSGLASEWAELETRRRDLIREADVRNAVELLPEWEAFIGLPDDCAALAPTLALRQAAAHERLTARGGNSLAALAAAAQSVGYLIEPTDFEEHSPFRVGESRAGEPLNGDDWAHAATLHAPVEAGFYAMAGSAAAGDALISTGNELLECTLASAIPAHASLLFEYDQPFRGWAPWVDIQLEPLEITMGLPAVAAGDE